MENKFRLASIVDCGGSLKKQWYVSYTIYDDDGKRLRKKIYIPTTLNKVERYAHGADLVRTVNKMLQSGELQKIASQKSKNIPRLSYALKTALDAKSAYLSDRTIDSYRSQMNRLLTYAKGKRIELITEFTHENAIEFLEKAMKARRWKAKTYNTAKGDCKTLFDYCLDRKWIEENPFGSIKLLPMTQPEPRNWPESDIVKYFNHLKTKDPAFYLISKLIYQCFLRPNEIRNLKVYQVKFEQGIILVGGDITKNNKTQPISLPNDLANELKAWIKDAPKDYFVFSTKRTMLPGDTIKSRNVFNERFANYRRKLNLDPEVDLYGLKHSGNLAMASAGVPLLAIKEQNRHHSINQTNEYINRIMVAANPHFKDWKTDF